MKRVAIRETVGQHLEKLGFKIGMWRWSRAELRLDVDGTSYVISLRSGISKRDLAFALGRIAGWADILGFSNVVAIPAQVKYARAA